MRVPRCLLESAGVKNELEFWSQYSGLSTTQGTAVDHMVQALGKNGYTGTPGDMLGKFSSDMVSGAGTVGDNIRKMAQFPFKGLMFLKSAKVNNNGAYANLSGGTGTFAVSATRSATSPATYFDANGVMQVTTTSNVGRFTQGYYDETGWHSAPSELIEGQSTNLIIRTDGTSESSGIWTGWTVVESSLASPSTKSQVSIPELTSISGAYSQRIQYVGDAADSNDTLTIDSISSSVSSVAQNDNITISGWIRTQTTCVNKIKIQIKSRDSSDNYISTYASSACSISTDWRRFHYTATITDATVSRVKASIGIINDVDASDNIDFEIYGIQIEKSLYPSSFIPTATAALTRGAESLAPSAAGNFPAPSGGNCLSFDGANASGDDYVSIANSATGNQISGSTSYEVRAKIFVRSDGEGDAGRIIDKAVASGSTHALAITSQSGGNVALLARFGRGTTNAQSQSTVAVSTNVWHTVKVLWDCGDGTDHKPLMYVDDVEVSYQAGATGGAGTIADDSSNALIVGNNAVGGATFDGFIQSLQIYRNGALTASYGFVEGTGTTITDTIAANNGTISGATWSKDTMQGTVLLEYMPIMLPNEQDASYKAPFTMLLSSGNRINFSYDTNANNKANFECVSNNNNTSISSSALTTWTRYSTHTLIGTWSTTADGAGKKIYFYIDGTSVGTPGTQFAVPAGVLPLTFSIQSSAGQAMGLRTLAIWDRVLSASEVATAYSILNT